jgi:hypothetical protein
MPGLVLGIAPNAERASVEGLVTLLERSASLPDWMMFVIIG